MALSADGGTLAVGSPDTPGGAPPPPPPLVAHYTLGAPVETTTDLGYNSAPLQIDPTGFNGLRLNEDWSTVVTTDGQTIYIMRWGDSWGSSSPWYDNYGDSGRLSFGWHNCVSAHISRGTVPSGTQLSFAVTYDSALYASDPDNLHAVTAGPQPESSVIKMYRKIGDGPWEQPDFEAFTTYSATCADQWSSQTIRLPYYGTGRIEGVELYNAVLELVAPPPPPPGAVAVYAWDGASWQPKGAALRAAARRR